MFQVLLVLCLQKSLLKKHIINYGQCSLMKFIRYPLHNSTGAFCVWVRVLSNYRDCAIITWRGGGWKIRRGHRRNDNKREGGLDLKFNTYRAGHYFFIPFCKLEKQWKSYWSSNINTNIGIKLTNLSTLRCSDL